MCIRDSDIIAEIELEAKRKKDLNKRYPFIESVEYEMKNLQQNRDDRSYLFPSVDKKALRLTPSHLDERAVKVQKNYTEIASSIHKCLSDMQTQRVNVDELTKDKSISKDDKRKFCSALKSGNQELIFQYLDSKPELINQQFSLKESPLFIACKLGHEKIATELLKRGANSRAKDFLGRTCKEIALRHGHQKTAHVIDLWNLYNT
eukprot:TRINITY_DN16428_c0_g1_i2.p2 TRINITY_DN16428_c0_g1~~TRINITY_DN16428_c0_g1_i2.p2  ORF type:complete len:205 (-),score=59.58 TRINITY_DN16428_c0_g1_i2:77-691(-)